MLSEKPKTQSTDEFTAKYQKYFDAATTAQDAQSQHLTNLAKEFDVLSKMAASISKVSMGPNGESRLTDTQAAAVQTMVQKMVELGTQYHTELEKKMNPQPVAKAINHETIPVQVGEGNTVDVPMSEVERILQDPEYAKRQVQSFAERGDTHSVEAYSKLLGQQYGSDFVAQEAAPSQHVPVVGSTQPAAAGARSPIDNILDNIKSAMQQGVRSAKDIVKEASSKLKSGAAKKENEVMTGTIA